MYDALGKREVIYSEQDLKDNPELVEMFSRKKKVEGDELVFEKEHKGIVFESRIGGNIIRVNK